MTPHNFTGFPHQTLKFLEQLRDNNSREWYNENKISYEKYFKIPAKSFAAAMSAELAELTTFPHQEKIYRIHRDLRFTKDKTPYNSHLHISFTPEDLKGDAPPCWFFSVEPGSLTLGLGVFTFSKTPLEKFRQRISEGDGEKLKEILTNMTQQGYRVGEPELKRVPRPYPQDHTQAELLKHKGLTVWFDFATTELISKPELIDGCYKHFKIMKPVFDWIADQ